MELIEGTAQQKLVEVTGLMAAYAKTVIESSPADVLYYATNYETMSKEELDSLNLSQLKELEIKKDGVKVTLQDRFEAYDFIEKQAVLGRL